MADRVYPSAKPNTQTPTATANGGASAFQPPKSQLYRPTYRPQVPPAKRRRSRRRLCCTCCLWLTLLIVALVFLAAIAGGIFYVLYRPHRPTFSVSTLRLTAFNLTAGGALTSRIDIAVTARNPNKKIDFVYASISIAATSDGADVGDGSFPGFVHEAKNTTVMRATVASTAGQTLDSSAAAELKKKISIPLEIQLETKAGVKIGGLSTKRVGISVTCDEINVAVPKGKKSAAAAAGGDASCKVKFRVKIWKWTF